jgi:hypothetical protein
MKRNFWWTSGKSLLFLGFLVVALTWSHATWSRSQRTGHQFARLSDVLRQSSHEATAQPNAATKARHNEAYCQLPLSFETNVGQIDPQVDFVSHGSGYTLFLTPREAVLALSTASASSTTGDRRNDRESAAEAVLRMKFIGSETKLRAAGQEELPGKVNYFIGKDSRRWRTGISTYAKVVYENLYPGVDLVYYGNQQQLEYDFIVRPGTDPDIIALSFEGAGQLTVDAQGELVLPVGGGEIRQRKPLIYQEVNGVRHEVAGSYQLKDRDTVGFELADYDASRPLVIDPVLVYSTFLSSRSENAGLDITVDALGNAYVTGYTLHLSFPTTVGSFDTTHNGSRDAFVTKLNPSGSALVYSTFLGGFGQDIGRGIAVDITGSAFVTGLTSSTNFPATVGSIDTTHNGGMFDAFVTKLNPDGSALLYSTFLGGVEFDGGNDIAVDTSGNAYVAGHTQSDSFPTTAGAFDTTHSPNENLDVFVTKLNSAGSALLYSTFLGGSNGALSPGIAVDTSGSAYVTGTTSSADFPTTIGAFDTTPDATSDVFVTKLNQAGTALIYSTVLGDSGLESSDNIAIDTSGSVYVAGTTSSPNFPTTVGAFDTTYNGGMFDAFVTKLNPAGSALVYSTFLGGVDLDAGDGIAVDTSGSAYITGFTLSPDFPMTVDGFDTTHNGSRDAFVTKLNPSGSMSLVYSTFLGGSSEDEGIGIALDIFGSAYVTGLTFSPEFPTTVEAFDTMNNGDPDAFVVKLSTPGGLPATVTLNPPAATNAVDSQHCITAAVQDALQNPVANIVVRFQVTGSVNLSDSATTDANGQATFCYVGPPLPGADAITVYADTNGNNVQDQDEPSGVAEKTWVLPISTPLCEINNGGWIRAENGDRASFGGIAKANESGETRGQQEYQDHGPVQHLRMHSMNVLAVVCDGSNRASIFGQATINGSGIFNYRINVQDVGGPGRGEDKYWLLMNGYNSGEQTLRGGNIQIRRK